MFADYLEGFKGYLHADGYSGYHQLEPEITLCGCFAHLRRKVDESLKIIPKDKQNASLEKIALDFIAKLFKAEEGIVDFDKKLEIRLQNSKPILDEFYEFIYQNDK